MITALPYSHHIQKTSQFLAGISSKMHIQNQYSPWPKAIVETAASLGCQLMDSRVQTCGLWTNTQGGEISWLRVHFRTMAPCPQHFQEALPLGAVSSLR